jgi:hypothetical protein
MKGRSREDKRILSPQVDAKRSYRGNIKGGFKARRSRKLRAHRGKASDLTISVCTWGEILFSNLALTYAMQREIIAQRAMTANVNPIKALRGESERLSLRIEITDRMKAISKRIPSIP